MKTVLFLSVIFGSIVLSLAIIAGTILLGIKILKGGVSGKNRANHVEETRMIQDIYKGLSGMEGRVESLETLLMDRDGKKGKHENET